MLQSFIVYSLFAASMWGLGTISAKRERLHYSKGKHLTFWTWDVVLTLFVFAFISGVRWQVGTDHLTYLSWYERVKSVGEFRAIGIELGFDFITKLFALLNFHFTFFFAFIAFLQLFFLYKAFQNERYLYPFIGVIVILGSEYLSWMNGMRQMIAGTMFVFSIQYIINRKFVSYFITILLATLIHQSALLLFVFYFIPQKDYFKYRYINIGLLIITLLIGMNPDWIHAGESIGKILTLVGYEKYSGHVNLFLEDSRELPLGPRRLSILLLNIFTVWYAPKLKEHFKSTNYLVYFNFAFVGVLLYNLLANTHHIFLRPLTYFTLFLVLTTSYLLYYLKPQKKHIVTWKFLVVFFVAISYTYLSVIADYGKGDMDWSNFKFFWNYV